MTDTRRPTGHEMDIVLVFYILGSIIYNILTLLLSPVLSSSHTEHNMEPRVRSSESVQANSVTDKKIQQELIRNIAAYCHYQKDSL